MEKFRKWLLFPIGCCGMASDLLQRYLFEQGIFTWYMSGRHGYGIDSESHAWLETTDGTIIDITGDQYKYKKLKFKTPVYVGVLADRFHDRFELDEPVAYERKEDPLGINRKAEIRYKTVMKYINKIY